MQVLGAELTGPIVVLGQQLLEDGATVSWDEAALAGVGGLPASGATRAAAPAPTPAVAPATAPAAG